MPNVSVMTAVRWLLLVNALVALAGATVAYRPMHRVMLGPWQRFVERRGDRSLDELPIYRERRVRLWWLFTGMVMLVAWWYLGTADGSAMVQRMDAPEHIHPGVLPEAAVAQTSVASLRSAVARLIPFAAVLAWLAFGIYSLYVRRQVRRYIRGTIPPKPDRWNPAYYSAGAEPWLARMRWIDRWGTAVWLGVIVGGNALYFLIMP